MGSPSASWGCWDTSKTYKRESDEGRERDSSIERRRGGGPRERKLKGEEEECQIPIQFLMDQSLLAIIYLFIHLN